MSTDAPMRIGFGEDAHALKEGLPLFIGGVEIKESPLGALAHSDGDVFLHALADALLSAFALGDIGHYFPPSRPEYKNLASHKILAHVQELISKQAYALTNVAAVITLDTPKLGSYRQEVQKNVANLLHLDASCVGLGFKTSEGLAPNHIQARVTVLFSLVS